MADGKPKGDRERRKSRLLADFVRRFTSHRLHTQTSGEAMLEVLEGRVLLAGTPQLLANVNAGTRPSNPGQFTQVGTTVFFAASDSANGRELWKTDGTAAGTTLVKDIRPGSGGSYAEYLTNFNGTLFFVANNGTNGRELWRAMARPPAPSWSRTSARALPVPIPST